MNKADRRVLALVTDAYGGLGGIAAYNRDVFQALSEHPCVAETIVVPRVNTFQPSATPDRVVQLNDALRSTPAYLATVLAQLRRGKFNLIHCAHANLAPVALAASLATRLPWTLSLYGVEVWERRSKVWLDGAIARATLYLPISDVTESRFRAAYPEARAASSKLPNALHRSQFAPGLRSHELSERYGLGEMPVLMTMSRLGADYGDKGFERVIRILPRLILAVPGLRYVICGSGPAKIELERIAVEAGVRDRLLFTGYIDEREKAEHYRLADAFVMPSMGEGFGFVFTEAMACGIPVVASNRDGGLDALRGGSLGRAVDPLDPDALFDGIVAALNTPKHVPAGLDYFDYPHFRERFSTALEPLWR